ncbi:hypothetical protein RDp07_gp58 [Roseobacter phage RD-1410Ws-07]|uniref:Uncharacterized protein n=2 Tax=Sanyabayvirus DS1410Ws06 TaxID=2844087 RepID=A0A191VYT1_9CAUD|nr:virion structural protein [Dinoroseobacter phage DS-1410Ws-06]ANJ20718.1 hypothetical protein DSp06_gp61 [Dinoroseobacter phage DS-1410Ws-06]ANJ20869.1 hypothetical protein RDp07_gp58 [Roseobacter phage RD-1410Ws-07]
MSESVTNIDNSSDLANSLFTTLTAGVTIPASPDFNDPKFSFTPDQNSALYSDITGATIAEVTEANIDGAGAFDVFMKSMDAHLEREFKGNRITGAQYAEVYTAVANQVMGQAVSFTLQKDQARWAAVTAQMQARIAEIQATVALVELERAKIQAANDNFQLNLTAAQYALTKMQLASEEARHDGITVETAMKQYQLNYDMPADVAIKHYERQQVMPSTVAMNNVQVDRILPAQASIAEYQNRVLQPLEADIQTLQRDRVITIAADIEEFRRDNMLPIELAQQQHIVNIRQPAESELIHEQIEKERANTLETRRDGLTPISGVIGLQKRNLTADADIKEYNLNNTLPTQLTLLNEQITLTNEQGEAERAKTLDNRSDGAVVEGSVGKQKDLYDQQIDSFIKDAQYKAGKLYSDAWVTQKTLDEGIAPPTQFNEANINAVLQAMRTNNNL